MTNSSTAPKISIALPYDSTSIWVGLLGVLSLLLAMLQTLGRAPLTMELLLVLGLVVSFPLFLRLKNFLKFGEALELVLALIILVAAYVISEHPLRSLSLEMGSWVLALGMLRLSFLKMFERRLRWTFKIEATGRSVLNDNLDSSLFLKKKKGFARNMSFGLLGLAVVLVYVWGVRFENPSLGWQSAIAILAVSSPALLYLLPFYVQAIFLMRTQMSPVEIRDPDILEKVMELTHIAFDKTGTLTEGKPEISLIKSIENISHKDILQYCASAEDTVEHPIAEAIRAAAKKENLSLLPVDERHYEAAKGVKVKIRKNNKAQVVLLGNLVWLFENGVESSDIPDELRWEAEGSQDSVLWLAVDGRPSGVLTLKDRIRESAESVVRELDSKGFEVGLITADSETVARAMAKRLKLKFYHFEISPQQKPTVIRRLSEKKKKGMDFVFPKLMFVGDGINDAEAMKEAYIGLNLKDSPDQRSGMSLKSGSLREAADLFLWARDCATKNQVFYSIAYFYHLLVLIVFSGLLEHFFSFSLSLFLAPFVLAIFAVLLFIGLGRVLPKPIENA